MSAVRLAGAGGLRRRGVGERDQRPAAPAVGVTQPSTPTLHSEPRVRPCIPGKNSVFTQASRRTCSSSRGATRAHTRLQRVAPLHPRRLRHGAADWRESCPSQQDRKPRITHCSRMMSCDVMSCDVMSCHVMLVLLLREPREPLHNSRLALHVICAAAAACAASTCHPRARWSGAASSRATDGAPRAAQRTRRVRAGAHRRSA